MKDQLAKYDNAKVALGQSYLGNKIYYRLSYSSTEEGIDHFDKKENSKLF